MCQTPDLLPLCASQSHYPSALFGSTVTALARAGRSLAARDRRNAAGAAHRGPRRCVVRQVTAATPPAPRAGDRVIAWCGPQPNLKLLLNYGIVDENNPYDKLTVTATVPTAGPLFQAKRRLLETASALRCACLATLRPVAPRMRMPTVCSGSEFMLKVDTPPFAPVATRMRVRRAASVLSTVCVRWRMLARCADMATKFDFQLQRNKGLPEQLIAFLRICYCEDEAALKGIDVKSAGDITEADVPILQHLALFLQQRLARCALPASQRGALLVPRLPGASARESRREQGLTDDPRGCRHPRSMPC